MKNTLGIYEAKASFSKIIKAVKTHGAVFRISDRGMPVAQIVPISESSSLADRISDLIKSGDLTPARNAREFPAPISKRVGGLERFLRERE